MKPRFVLLSSVFALACGDSTPDPGADGGLSECMSFAECGGPNNVQTVNFCEHCFARPDTHVCEGGGCRELTADFASRGQLSVAFTVPSAALGGKSAVLAALLPTDGAGGAVTCDRLLPGGPAVFGDRSLNTTNAVAVTLTPPGDPSFAYRTTTSADPGSNRLIYLGVTSEVQGKGTLMAEGCLEGIEVRAGETHNLSVTLSGR
jgi:hypothetical protein